jgi:hypothetical protein
VLEVVVAAAGYLVDMEAYMKQIAGGPQARQGASKHLRPDAVSRQGYDIV